MKLIKVILRPEKGLCLKDVLSGMGYHGITTKESSGHGEHKQTIKQVFRGKIFEKRTDAVNRIELEFVIQDENVTKVVDAIRNTASTDQGGDGRIYISPLDDAIHIHGGDKHLGDSDEKGLEDDKSNT